MELEGQVALVTGASSGLGKAAALKLAAAGARIGVLSRTRSEIDKAVAEIEQLGGKALPLMADIADADLTKKAVDDLITAYGRLDIVFANAGINGVWAPIDDIQPAEWDHTIAVNLRGTYLTLHYAVPHLKKQGGSIIITSSINGTRTFTSAGATAYACTKAAQLAMTQMLALELAKHRIRVNAICPGMIDTNIPDSTDQRGVEESQVRAKYPDGDIPLTGGEAGTSEEVADLVLFLASERSRHITGTPVWIDGGQSLLV